MPRRWDVICRVVDHYGDAGVCLRVARALAASPGRDVRLLVDRPEVVLALIQPPPRSARDASTTATGVAADPAWAPPLAATTAEARGDTWRDRSGVLIASWDAPPREVDVVLETFGGDLPPALLADLRARHTAGRPCPVWLNLEYLSAEDWVEGCHGLPSPQAGGLTRWFVFPGFTPGTAGLPGPQTALPALPPDLQRLVRRAPLTGSLFCYRDSPLPALLDAIEHGPRDTRLLVPTDMPGDLGGRALGAGVGATWTRQHLTLVRIPFVDQDLYDAVLAHCDFNIVRGEDSFVRAQWAGRPLLWAAYLQDADAHHAKVDAWLARCAMPPPWAALNRWFNGMSDIEDVAALWAAADAGFGDATDCAARWHDRLEALPSLELALADFASRHLSPLE